MAWTTPRTYVAGEILTAPQMNQFQRDQLRSLQNRLTNLLLFESSVLTNDVSDGVAEWLQWGAGSDQIKIAMPDRPVTVYAMLTGRATTNAANVNTSVQGRTRISFDSGTSFVDGGGRSADTVDNDTANVTSGTLMALQTRSGTPTGHIEVEAIYYQGSGVSGDVKFRDGTLNVVMVPYGV